MAVVLVGSGPAVAVAVERIKSRRRITTPRQLQIVERVRPGQD